MEAVLFDYYGVIGKDPLQSWRLLHDLTASQWQAVQHICANSDAGIIDLTKFYGQLGELVGLSGEVTHQQLDKSVGIDLQMVELLKQLRHNKFKVALLSNSGMTLRHTLDQFGLAPLFDAITISSEVGAVKPNKKIFDIALNQLTTSPELALFFDDRQSNVEGALAAGLKAEVFIDAHQCHGLLKAYGCLER
jgi:putative hydrolase of the HAD superfamily